MDDLVVVVVGGCGLFLDFIGLFWVVVDDLMVIVAGWRHCESFRVVMDHHGWW